MCKWVVVPTLRVIWTYAHATYGRILSVFRNWLLVYRTQERYDEDASIYSLCNIGSRSLSYGILNLDMDVCTYVWSARMYLTHYLRIEEYAIALFMFYIRSICIFCPWVSSYSLLELWYKMLSHSKESISIKTFGTINVKTLLPI